MDIHDAVASNPNGPTARLLRTQEASYRAEDVPTERAEPTGRDTDVRMFTCPDLLPTGQTGFDLSRSERADVRTYYREGRRTYTRTAAKRFATLLARDYDRSEYGQ